MFQFHKSYLKEKKKYGILNIHFKKYRKNTVSQIINSFVINKFRKRYSSL